MGLSKIGSSKNFSINQALVGLNQIMLQFSRRSSRVRIKHVIIRPNQI